MMVERESRQGGATGDVRFAFGDNWASFLERVDERSVEAAQQSLRNGLMDCPLEGRSFLDAGSGSGLSSLAARRLGAEILSFDRDPRSVACTEELKRRYFPNDEHWRIVHGDLLDGSFMARLGRFDVVYSWGVLHHTGRMWEALGNVAGRVVPGGLLLVALYNDQGWKSGLWRALKRTYCRLPKGARWVVLYPAAVRIWGPAFVRDLLLLRPGSAWREYGRERGMSPWHDVVDWVGGYPFEVARPEEVSARLEPLGFDLLRQDVTRGYGCNEFLFRRRKGT